MDIHSFGRTPKEADRLYRKQVERAWLSLVERGGEVDPKLRDVVRDSWLRCLAMGVERGLGRAGAVQAHAGPHHERLAVLAGRDLHGVAGRRGVDRGLDRRVLGGDVVAAVVASDPEVPRRA